NLTTYTGTPRLSISTGTSTSASLAITNLQNDVNLTFDGDGTNGRSLIVTISALTGSADLLLSQTVNLFLSVANASAYTGDVSWSGATQSVLNFNNDLVSGGGLVVPSTG